MNNSYHKMKIALCLSGQPRFYKEAYYHIKTNLIDRYNIKDIFCHFWWDPQTNYQGELASWSSYLYGHKKSFEQEDNILQNLIDLYDPIKISYDKPSKTTDLSSKELDKLRADLDENLPFDQYPTKYKNWAYNHLKSIIESQYKTLQHKLEYEKSLDTKYDLVIKTRYDIRFEQEKFPTINEIKSLLAKNSNNYYRDWDNFWMYSSKLHDSIIGGMWQDFERLFGFITSSSFLSINPYKFISLKASPEHLHWARLMELGLFPKFDNELETKHIIIRKS